jgi:hypothetical protein
VYKGGRGGRGLTFRLDGCAWALLFASVLDANTIEQRQEVLLRHLIRFPLFFTLGLLSSGAQFQVVNHFVRTLSRTRKLCIWSLTDRFGGSHGAIVCGAMAVQPYPRVAVTQRQVVCNDYSVHRLLLSAYKRPLSHHWSLA